MAQTIEVPITLKLLVDHETQPAVKSFEPDQAYAAINVLKTADERQYTLGVAYPAMKADSSTAADGHRDFVSQSALEDAAWSWMTKHRNIGLHHQDGADAKATVVESYIYRGPDWVVTSPVDGNDYIIKAGDWCIGCVWSPEGWALVKKGLVRGFSPQGSARRRVPTVEQLASLRG